MSGLVCGIIAIISAVKSLVSFTGFLFRLLTGLVLGLLVGCYRRWPDATAVTLILLFLSMILFASYMLLSTLRWFIS